MGIGKKTPAEIFSCAVIGLSLACLSGLGLGHATEKSMYARLSATPPADPVERYALGQNAYKKPYVSRKAVPAQAPQYADASFDIGRYEKGVRILAPEEPARKIERLRREKLQDWNEENFGSGRDKGSGYAEMNMDYQPIDVGAVMEAPDSPARHAAADQSPLAGS